MNTMKSFTEYLQENMGKDRFNKLSRNKVDVINLHHGSEQGTRYVRQWEVLMNQEADTCSNLDCPNKKTKPALVGAHVKLDDGKHGPTYIIPLCHSCNSYHNNDPMTVFKDQLALLKEVNKIMLEDDESELCIVVDNDDVIVTALNKTPQLLLEYSKYQPFGDTKCVYRLDRGTGAPGNVDHIHVYADKQHNHHLYAIRYDGASHDGSKYQLSRKHQDALRQIGFTVPENGLLEWRTLDYTCKLLLD